VSEPRFHKQEASDIEKFVRDWLIFIAFFGAVILSLYVGTWPVVVGWLSFHWTTIWQVFVLLLLMGIVGKR
jgi:hypothetical protein